MYNSVDALSDSGDEIQEIPAAQPEPKTTLPVIPKSSHCGPLALARGECLFFIFLEGGYR